MRKTKLLLVAFMAMVGLSSYALDYVVDQTFTSIDDLINNGTLFSIVNTDDEKGLCFGNPTEQNMYYDTYTNMVENQLSYTFKLEHAQGDGVESYYYLRPYKPNGELNNVWGWGGYFNSQPADGWCDFCLGLNGQNGQDITNGAVWELENDGSGKFALKNIGTGKYLKDAAPAKYDDPTYFTFCTLKVDLSSLKAKYATVAAEAEAAGVDASLISAHNAAVASATTGEEVQAAIQALLVAINVVNVNAAINGETGVDLTGFVVNADFEAGSLTGWTSAGRGGHLAGNKNFSLMKGNDYVEDWRGDGVGLGNGSLTHDAIGLPAGVYRISADAQNVEQYNDNAGGTGLFLYANDDKEEIGSAANYSVYTTLAADGPMTIKFVLDNCTGNWISYDNIKLTYFKQASDFLTFAVADAEAALADPAYANITGDELAALIAVKNTPAAGSTLADYQDAANNIYAAIDAFKAAASSYNAYATYKAETEALFGTDFGVAAPTTAAEAVAAVAALNIAQYDKVSTEYIYSLSGLIGDFGTWTGTATVEGAAATPNYLDWEHWSGKTHAYYEQASNGWGSNAWTIQYQKTCTLPAGKYVLKVAARSSSETKSKVTCTATETTIALPCAGNNTRGINTSGVASWDDSDEFAHTGKDNKLVPPSVGGTGTGWQWRFLPFELTDKTEVTMTFYAEANSKYQWMSISDGELLSLDPVATSVAYDEAKKNTVKNIDIANVTVKRTVKTNAYNTVVLPFNLTANQVAEAFGTGCVVYNYSENSNDASQVTVNFKKGDGSIKANVPVLVKATEPEVTSTQWFLGVQVEAPTGDPKVEGKNIDFVGTYAPISNLAAGNFFINSGKLYKSEGKTNIKPFRAYLKPKAEAAARVELYIDGIATGIEAINADMTKSSDAAIYNLNGQRVQKAQRGLYIMDGKKVLVK